LLDGLRRLARASKPTEIVFKVPYFNNYRGYHRNDWEGEGVSAQDVRDFVQWVEREKSMKSPPKS